MNEQSLKNKDLTNITIMNYDRVKGFNVRIRQDGERITKLFNPDSYGSEEQALREAQKFRDQVKQDWKDAAKLPERKIQYKTTNTGVVAISKTTDDQGRVILRFNYTDADGQHHSKGFLVGPPGGPDYQQRYEEAMNKAIRFRNKKNTQIYGVRWVNYIIKREGEYL